MYSRRHCGSEVRQENRRAELEDLRKGIFRQCLGYDLDNSYLTTLTARRRLLMPSLAESS